jgi:hypothetical protein
MRQRSLAGLEKAVSLATFLGLERSRCPLRLAPRSGIDSDQASAVVIQRTDENTTVVSAARVRHAANDWSELTIDIEAYPNSGVADFGIAPLQSFVLNLVITLDEHRVLWGQGEPTSLGCHFGSLAIAADG